MEAKFTKGPWKAYRDNGKDTQGQRHMIVTPRKPQGHPICSVFLHDEDEANAALTAAAPELYEAVESILPDIESEIEQRKHSGNDEDWSDLEKKANGLRAALAKARDETLPEAA